ETESRYAGKTRSTRTQRHNFVYLTNERLQSRKAVYKQCGKVNRAKAWRANAPRTEQTNRDCGDAASVAAVDDPGPALHAVVDTVGAKAPRALGVVVSGGKALVEIELRPAQALIVVDIARAVEARWRVFRKLHARAESEHLHHQRLRLR